MALAARGRSGAGRLAGRVPRPAQARPGKAVQV